MRTFYEPILARFNPLIANGSIRWADLNTGQLKKKDAKTGRYAVAFPCALVGIALPKTEDITDYHQRCKAVITVTLAFDPFTIGRTAANAPESVRDKALEPYDIIAEVYKRLQGFDTEHFDSLVRTSQAEVPHNDLFVYQIVFQSEFEDYTAEE